MLPRALFAGPTRVLGAAEVALGVGSVGPSATVVASTGLEQPVSSRPAAVTAARVRRVQFMGFLLSEF
jgi:hypothetical protein